MYKIRPYLIQEIHEGIVVQNGISTTAITSERVIEFLKEIERQNYITIEDALLIDFFGNDCEEVISFLISNEIIEHIEEISYNYKYIKILTNSQEFSEVVEFCKSDFDEKIIVYTINELDKCLEKITKDDMILVYMNPFNMEKYIEISDLLIEKDIIIRTSFFYNHNIYISNLYKRQWRNPCPKCFFYDLETQLRAEPVSKGMNFQTIIDLLYKKNPRFEVKFPIKKTDMIFILNILRNQKAKPINDGANIVYQYNIKTKMVSQDYAYHWEMCDCYE